MKHATRIVGLIDELHPGPSGAKGELFGALAALLDKRNKATEMVETWKHMTSQAFEIAAGRKSFETLCDELRDLAQNGKESPQDRASATGQWEYNLSYEHDVQNMAMLNHYGALGWELVGWDGIFDSSRADFTDQQAKYRLIWKRRKNA